jgi:hypothetical protein
MLVNQKGDSKGPDGSNLPRSANESGLLRQSLGNSAKWPPLWLVLSANRTREEGVSESFDAVRSLSLRTGTGWFGFAIASAKTLAGTLVADVADIEMSRRP